MNDNDKKNWALRLILQIAFKHETQYWLDEPGTDTEKLERIAAIAREALHGEEELTGAAALPLNRERLR